MDCCIPNEDDKESEEELLEKAKKIHTDQEFPALADIKVVDSVIKASAALKVPTKVGVGQSKDSFFGEVEPERMPVSEYLDMKWKAWQGGSVGASEMEAATLFTLSSILGVQSGGIFAVETHDKETIHKITKIVLESIYHMEKENEHV